MNHKFLITACIVFLGSSLSHVFAMEAPDWWGAELNGSHHIGVKVQQDVLSLDIADCTSLKGEVRAPTVEITYSDEKAKCSLLQNVKFKADKLCFNGNILEGVCAPFSPQIAAQDYFTFLLTGKNQNQTLTPTPTLTSNALLTIEMKDLCEKLHTPLGAILEAVNKSVESFKLLYTENTLKGERYKYWKMHCPLRITSGEQTYDFNIIDLHHAQYKEFGFLGSLGGDHPGKWEFARPLSIQDFKNKLREFTNQYNECLVKDAQYEVQKIFNGNTMYIRKNQKVNKREANKICIMFPDVNDNGRGLAFRFCRINDLALDPHTLGSWNGFSGSYYEIQFHSKVKFPYTIRENGFNAIMPAEKFL